jgi:hypothetical protein
MREGIAEKAAPARERVVPIRINALKKHPTAQARLDGPRHAGSLHKTLKAEEGFYERPRHQRLIFRGGLRVRGERERSRIRDTRDIVRHSTSRAPRNVVGRCIFKEGIGGVKSGPHKKSVFQGT